MATNKLQELEDATEQAFERLSKAVLRRRTLTSLVRAIEADIKVLNKDDNLRKRSVSVLEYMRGYISVVEAEYKGARAGFEMATYKEQRAKIIAERKKSAD